MFRDTCCRKWVLMAVLVLALLVAGRDVVAGDSKGRFQSYNPLLSCGAFVQLQSGAETLEKAASTWWLIGFLSGVSNGLPNTFDIVGRDGLFSALQWVIDYCRTRPHIQFKRAAEALIANLHPHRLREAP